jgi:chromosome segregation ATPase
MGLPLPCKISDMIKSIKIGNYQYNVAKVLIGSPGEITSTNSNTLSLTIANDDLTKLILGKLKNKIDSIKIESNPDLKWLLRLSNKRDSTITLKVKTKQQKIDKLKGKIEENKEKIEKLDSKIKTINNNINILTKAADGKKLINKQNKVFEKLNKEGKRLPGLEREQEKANERLTNNKKNKESLTSQLQALESQNNKIKDDFKNIETISLIFDGVTLREYNLKQERSK